MNEVSALPSDSLGKKGTSSESLSKVGGVGGGTGLAILGDHLGGFWGSAFVYASPAIAYILGALLLFANAWANRLLAKRVMNELRKDVQATLQSPYVSDDDKEEVRARFSKMELAAIKSNMERGKLLLDVQFNDYERELKSGGNSSRRGSAVKSRGGRGDAPSGDGGNG